MASIEQRGSSYRIIFRYNGQRFTRSLHTKCERVATAALHRLEDNLRRVQLGTPPTFIENERFPWLTPNTFNGWFIPEGASKRLGEMSLEESWKYDFRTHALECLLNRLEEYAAALNLPPHAYSRLRHVPPSNQLLLFPEIKPVLIVLGKTCAGKSTFGELVAEKHKLHWIEASNVLRTFKSKYDDEPGKDFDFARHTLESKGQDVVARTILQLYANEVSEGIVITGFRAIEELEAIKSQVGHAKVVLVEASERARFQRHLARGRLDEIKTVREFKTHDVKQWSFGLLRVAEDFADIRITNEGTIQDYRQQIESLLSMDIAKTFPGVSWGVNPRHGIRENQLYRCLSSLNAAGHSLSCDEIQEHTKTTGAAIRHNNANKVLKRVPELAKRYDSENERVRYEITNAGRAYVRCMKARFESPTTHEISSTTNE